MTRQEIFKEYSESNTKANYVNKLSKRLGVPKSTIICELLKSGFKYHELERSMKNDYASAEKKYQEWLDAGKPESEIVEKGETTTAMSEVTEAMKNLAESAENLAKLKADNIKLIEDMEKTEKINQGLLLENERLEEENKKALKDNEELLAIIDRHAKRIRGLEAEVEEAIAEKTKAEEMRDENLRLLQIRDRELAEVRAEKDNILSEKTELRKRNEDLEFEFEKATSDSEHYRQEMEMLKIKLSAEENEHLYDLEGMDGKLNDCEACMQGILGENQQYQREIERLKEDIDTVTKMYMKENKKRKKIQKAFLKAVTK